MKIIWTLVLNFLLSQIQPTPEFMVSDRDNVIMNAMQTAVPDAPHLLLSASDGEFLQEIQVERVEEYGVDIGSLTDKGCVRESGSGHCQLG